MESQTNAFENVFSSDILIAVMFLGQHEKEVLVMRNIASHSIKTFLIYQVILEKVVPRIKNVLDGVNNAAPVRNNCIPDKILISMPPGQTEN